MEEALYGDGGYYRCAEPRIGTDGDFITGSSYSPLFGRATAQLLHRLDRCFDRPADYLEVGFGSGVHLRHLKETLEENSRRRLLAWDRVERGAPDGVEILKGLEISESDRIDGMIFSYELFDALAVHRLVGHPGGAVGELWVDLEDGEFTYVEGDLSDPRLETMVRDFAIELQPGQIADLSPDWQPLYKKLASNLSRGLLVTCDYGFERSRLLDPRVRMSGTLACHRNHRVHRDALRFVGRQDLTAHVDFTTLRETGESLGLESVALTRQATWLVACGIFDDLQQVSAQERLGARALLNPEGMGEEIRVLVQGRGVALDSLFDVSLTGHHPSIQ